MQLRLFLLFLLYLTFSFGSGECYGRYEFYLPAYLSNGKGSLIGLNVSLVDEPNAVVVLNSKIGGDTIDSIWKAYQYASSKSKRECGVYVKFEDGIKNVEGPSGGAFLATIFYFLLNGNYDPSIMDNVVITGQIDVNGNIYPVGGLYEKATAALSKGKNVFITNIPTRLEVFLLDEIDGLIYINVDSVDDIIKILKKGVFKKNKGNLFNEFLPLKDVNTTEVEDFKVLYDFIREKYVSTLRELSTYAEKYVEFYNRSLYYSDKVAEKGFYYTSANELFLKLSEMYAMVSYKKGKGVYDLLEELQLCLKDYEIPPYREGSYEWAAGSIIRYYRAKTVYDAVVDARQDSVYASLDSMAKLAEALEWCYLAKKMANLSESKGKSIIDERLFKPYADSLLNKVRGKSLEGLYFYALEEYKKGHYLSVLYLLSSLVEEEEPYEDSLWYRVYKSQADYLNDISLKKYAGIYGKIAKVVDSVVKNKQHLNESVLHLNNLPPFYERESKGMYIGNEDNSYTYVLVFMLVVSLILVIFVLKRWYNERD